MPKNPKANITGYLVQFHADSCDDPLVEGESCWSIIGKVFKDEFEARMFWAAHKDTAAGAMWHGAGAWRYDSIKGAWTDAITGKAV